MPTVEHFLDLFEAVSRKDLGDIKLVANGVIEYERQKKHYSAASRIRQALDVLIDAEKSSGKLFEAGADHG